MILQKLCYAVAFLAEALITWLYIDYLFSRKRKSWQVVMAFAVGYMTLFAISALYNTTLNALAFILLNFFLLIWGFSCSIKTALLHTAFLCFAMVGSELLVMMILGLLGYAFSSFTYDLLITILLAVLSKTLYLVFSTVGSRLFSPHRHRQEEPRLMALFCSLPLLSAFAAVAIAYYGMTIGITGAIGGMTVAIVLILLIVDLIVLLLYNVLQQTNEEYLSLQLTIQKEQADAAYYQALQQQYENQRILIHDIRKHLDAISILAHQANAKEIENYVSGITSTLTPASNVKFCASSILNSLLLHWKESCEQAKVTFHCDVRDIDLKFMDAPSITTLFGNLLSNALEAAAQSAGRELELSVSYNEMRSAMMITVINSCDTTPVPDGNGGFFTRKRNIIKHGVGLKSIERAVRRYHGISTMYYDAENKQFHHILQFPLP